MSEKTVDDLNELYEQAYKERSKGMSEKLIEFDRRGDWLHKLWFNYGYKYGRNSNEREFIAALNCCKNDYWFMTNLLERYSHDKDQDIKDCIERMKSRKPLFNILKDKCE